MKKAIFATMGLLLALLVVGEIMAIAQSGNTTALAQVSAQSCQVTGCVNAKLSDGELFSFSDTLRYYGSYNINGRLAFRGLNYLGTGQSSGYQIIDLAFAGGQFAVHENIAIVRGNSQKWLNGSLTMANEYVGTDPAYYGSTEYPAYGDITTGTGQVGLVKAAISDTVVTLASSDTTQVQVPSEVTILAGSLNANFTVTATAPTTTGPGTTNNPNVTITATFPDGRVASMPVYVQPLPAPTPVNN